MICNQCKKDYPDTEQLLGGLCYQCIGDKNWKKVWEEKEHKRTIQSEIAGAMRVITNECVRVNDHEPERALAEAIANHRIPHLSIKY